MSNDSDPKTVVEELIKMLQKDLKAATDFDERHKLTHQLLQAVQTHHRLQGKTKGKAFQLG